MHTYNHAVEMIWQLADISKQNHLLRMRKKKEPGTVSHGRDCTDLKRKHGVTHGTDEWLQVQPTSSPFQVNSTLPQEG